MPNTLLKYGIAGLAALTTLGALLVILFILIQPEGSAAWTGARLLVAVYVVTMGALTALYLRAGADPPVCPTWLLLGAVGLVGLGSAGAVWGVHLAEVTGDLEAWAITINLLMAAQGGVTIWHLWLGTPAVPPMWSS